MLFNGLNIQIISLSRLRQMVTKDEVEARYRGMGLTGRLSALCTFTCGWGGSFENLTMGMMTGNLESDYRSNIYQVFR